MRIEKFEDIKAWQEARKLTNMIYEITQKMEFRRDFELVRQLRRSAISVMANIAEGFNRQTDKELIQFLFIASGSVNEILSHSYVASDQKYIGAEMFNNVLIQCKKVANYINAFIKYLRKR